MTHGFFCLLHRLITALLVGIITMSMTHTAAAQERGSDLERLDVSSNGVVNASDAGLIIDAWHDLQQEGECLEVYAAYEVSGRSCIDVSDIQKVLSSWGMSATTGQVQPDAPEVSTAQSQIFTVNSADDDAADHYCTTPQSKCTLRGALRLANLNGVEDEIRFDIRNPDGTCPSTTNPVQIRPNSTTDPAQQLLLDDANGMRTTINGFSQCGAAPNMLAVGGDAKIRVEIVGKASDPNASRENAYKVPGLKIIKQGNVVRGLAVYGWDYNIQVSGSNARNTILEGNFIGTNAAQTFKIADYSAYMPDNTTLKFQDRDGLRIQSFAYNTTVGGPNPAQRNIISGAWDGIALEQRAIDTRIYNNYIGLRQDGITPWGNAADGIDVNQGSRGTRIGGHPTSNTSDPAYRNVISGNFSDGIEIAHSPYIIDDTTPTQTYPTEDTYIVDNFIGISAFGGRINRPANSTSLYGGNGSNGITLEDAVREVFIRGNVIGDNGDNGVRLWSRITDSEIRDNFIGVGPDGATPLPNGVSLDPRPCSGSPLVCQWQTFRKGRHGIYLIGDSRRNKILNNVIANNKGYGILLNNGYTEYQSQESRSTDFNTISRNSIYNNGDWAYFNAVPKPPREFPYDDPELHSGIKLKAQSGDLPNKGIPSPSITSAYTNMARGTAKTGAGADCAGCVVEVFAVAAGDRSSSLYGQSQRFVGSATTDSSGRFAVGLSGVSSSDFVTATTTDRDGNSSEEARNVQVQGGSDPGGGAPGPTPTTPPAPTPPPTSVPPTPEPTKTVRLERLWLPIIRK